MCHLTRFVPCERGSGCVRMQSWWAWVPGGYHSWVPGVGRNCGWEPQEGPDGAAMCPAFEGLVGLCVHPLWVRESCVDCRAHGELSVSVEIGCVNTDSFIDVEREAIARGAHRRDPVSDAFWRDFWACLRGE